MLVVAWWLSDPLGSWADSSLPIPRTSSSAEQQIREEALYLKEETVSIASRYEQPISKAPSDVYIVTDEDIRQSGALDLPTILRRIPGMEVMQVTGADFNVSVRGNNQLTANKLLLMVDGRSIYVDVQGVNYWQAIPITLPEIKRIEVLKGPASVLYGFNAFDGVINIMTKSPEEMKGATVQVGGGELGTLRSAAVYANRHQQFSYRLSYGHDQNQQWRNRNAQAFRDDKFNVHTEYAISGDSKLSFSGGLVDVKDFDGNLTAEVVNTGVPALGYAHATYDQPNFFVRAFWNRYDINGPVTTNPLLAPFLSFTDRNFNPNQNMQGNTYNIEAQREITLGDTYRLTLGINYRHNTLSSNFIDRFRTEDRLGFYLQNEWKPSAWFQLVGGLRYDLDTFIHPTISPRGSLILTPLPDHTVRATAAAGYRPPTMFETFDVATAIITPPSPSPPLPPTRLTGSTNLAPEKIVSYELEYQGWYFQHRLRARAACFFNHMSDLIQPTGEGIVQGGVADIYGGEAGLEFLAAKWFSGFGNMAYQEIGQTFGGAAQRAAPRFKWNAGLRGQWENGLSGEIAYHYVGGATYPLSPAFLNSTSFGVVPPDTRVGHYQLLNVRAAYRFWREEVADGYWREAEVALSVFNALNDQHREHPLGDLLGTRVLGWLTLKL
ncbi:MAG: TonB-dependent receptor [Nitrospira sp.]|nr:TonB-dependent receptor [Nitrospira sp.]MDH4304631.1 TonB-dependent receptor [Nitrospira sp.]MDH5193632.1 TonB-dependent receptor [Nitrospira sp.]